MKTLAISLGAAALLLAGCNEQGRIEDHVRAQLSGAGATVTRVEMSKQGADEYSGYAMVRMADGREVRANCRMRRTGSEFQGTCGQVIDQQLVDSMKATIRQRAAAQGATVIAVEMARENDDLMAGHAMVRDASGTEGRINCTAPRDPSNGRFSLNCREAEDPAPAAAEAPAEETPSIEEQAPAEEQ